MLQECLEEYVKLSKEDTPEFFVKYYMNNFQMAAHFVHAAGGQFSEELKSFYIFKSIR